MSAKVVSFGCLNSQLAKDQTKVVMDRLQDANPRLACRLEVVPSPVPGETLEDEPFLAASAAEVEALAAGGHGDLAGEQVLAGA